PDGHGSVRLALPSASFSTPAYGLLGRFSGLGLVAFALALVSSGVAAVLDVAVPLDGGLARVLFLRWLGPLSDGALKRGHALLAVRGTLDLLGEAQVPNRRISLRLVSLLGRSVRQAHPGVRSGVVVRAGLLAEAF